MYPHIDEKIQQKKRYFLFRRVEPKNKNPISTLTRQCQQESGVRVDSETIPLPWKLNLQRARVHFNKPLWHDTKTLRADTDFIRCCFERRMRFGSLLQEL